MWRIVRVNQGQMILTGDYGGGGADVTKGMLGQFQKAGAYRNDADSKARIRALGYSPYREDNVLTNPAWELRGGYHVIRWVQEERNEWGMVCP